MRPRRHSPPPPPDAIVSRALEYKGHQIAKMSDGTFRLYPSYEELLDNSNWIVVDSPEDGRNKVDAKERPQRPTRPQRPVRPAPVEEDPYLKGIMERDRPVRRPRRPEPPQPPKEEYPRGGCMQNPPDRCRYKYRFEPEGTYWVDNPNCAFNCADPSCETYIELMKEHKLRIARLNYKAAEPYCEHCHAKVVRKELDEWTYECGTVYDRRNDKITFACKKPRPPKRPTRPQRPVQKEAPSTVTINRRRR